MAADWNSAILADKSDPYTWLIDNFNLVLQSLRNRKEGQDTGDDAGYVVFDVPLKAPGLVLDGDSISGSAIPITATSSGDPSTATAPVTKIGLWLVHAESQLRAIGGVGSTANGTYGHGHVASGLETTVRAAEGQTDNQVARNTYLFESLTGAEDLTVVGGFSSSATDGTGAIVEVVSTAFVAIYVGPSS